MKTQTEKEFLAADDPQHVFVKRESKLKEVIINYIGETIHPEEPNVTVEDVVKIFADEFPEFLFVVAQENFLNGYKHGLADASKEEKA